MYSSLAALWAVVPLLSTAVLAGKANTWEDGGDIGISSQMMFLGSSSKVYILDKAENNPARISGQYGEHAAWAAEYDWKTKKTRHQDVFSNTFCAGGIMLGNGTWAVFGGNKPVTTGGVDVADEGNVYRDTDGGTAIRMITPDQSGGSVEYIQGAQTFNIAEDVGGWLQMTSKRWYPTVEALADGSSVIFGGDINGGYVNDAGQDNPTYEFFPPTSDGAIRLQFLADTLPINLYPLTWLMPSGKLYMNSAYKTIMYDLDSREVTNLPDMPYAARIYPASGASTMLPLTPRNNYDATLLFCGGTNFTQWGDGGGPKVNVTAFPADQTCVRITPDGDATYHDDDDLLEGRSMGEFVLIPDGSIWLGNGVAFGTAGYGTQKYSTGASYGQDPVYMPAMYYPEKPAGQRWSREGMTASKNERMYHSTAILLPDSSILVGGSNPNADFTDDQWRSRTDVEFYYPSFYDETRPEYTGLPDSISYGGDFFDIVINGTSEADAKNTRVVLHRNGFHTHGLAMGQRMIELNSTYTIDKAAGTTTVHVSQIPLGSKGPALFQPGSAFMFVVVNGIPSMGESVMVGTGNLGKQPTAANAALPASSVKEAPVSSSSAQESKTDSAASPSSTDTGSNPQGAVDSKKSSGFSVTPIASTIVGAFGLIAGSLLM